jgi:hypothetical protein
LCDTRNRIEWTIYRQTEGPWEHTPMTTLDPI